MNNTRYLISHLDYIRGGNCHFSTSGMLITVTMQDVNLRSHGL